MHGWVMKSARLPQGQGTCLLCMRGQTQMKILFCGGFHKILQFPFFTASSQVHGRYFGFSSPKDRETDKSSVTERLSWNYLGGLYVVTDRRVFHNKMTLKHYPTAFKCIFSLYRLKKSPLMKSKWCITRLYSDENCQACHSRCLIGVKLMP